MDVDLRIPVGLLFVVLGLIMGVFGLTSDPAIYHKSFGINVNLSWGLVELIFGSLMIAFGRSHHELATAPTSPAATRKAATSRHDSAPSSPPSKPPAPKPKPPVPLG